MDPKAPKKPGGKKYWWAGGIVCALLVVGLLVGWAYVAGRQVWTDGRDISSPVSTANVRQVLWSAPEPLAAEFNTPGDEYEVCLSSDSNELFFVRGRPEQGADIYTSRRTHNKWSKPVRLDAINSKHDELGPRLSADGRLLLFYSNRPGGIGGYDIWVSQRTDGAWSEPVNLGPKVNSTHNEYGPSMTADNQTLYFASNRIAAERMGKKIQWRATIRQAELGDYDLFSAAVDFSGGETATTQPTTAPASDLTIATEQAVELEGVNTTFNEGTPCVSPWGDFLYFASNRPGGQGAFDLYRVRIEDGKCVRLENLGDEVNTPGNETDPQLTQGGFMLYFSSDRDGGAEGGYDLYTSESHEVYATRVGRPLPTLGWSVWVLLGSLLLLIPLMLFLRAGGYKHLSTLQKCFAVALALHLILTLALAAAKVSQDIYEYVIDEPQEVELDLAADTQLEEKLQIRTLLTDMAPAAPAETEVTRQDTEFEVRPEEVKTIPTNIPEAMRQKVMYVQEQDIPENDPKIKPEQVKSPSPTVTVTDLAINITPPKVKVSSKEDKPIAPATPPSPNQTRQTSEVVKTKSVNVASMPPEAAKPVTETLADAAAAVSRPLADVQPQDIAPTPKLTVMTIDAAVPKTAAKVVNETKVDSASKNAVNKPLGAARAQAAAPAAKAGTSEIKAPTVQADNSSTMAKQTPKQTAKPIGDAVERADTPTPKVVDVTMNVSGPSIRPAKQKSAPEPTKNVQADKPAGSNRAAPASKPTSVAGAADIAVPSIEPSGASLAMTGSPAEIAKPLGDVSPQPALPTPTLADVTISPTAPKPKTAPKHTETETDAKSPSGIAPVKSARTGPMRSTVAASKAGVSKVVSPAAASSKRSLASAVTVTRPVASVGEVSIPVNIPVPIASSAADAGPPTPPVRVGDAGAEPSVTENAKEVQTAGIGKIAAVSKPSAGPSQLRQSDTQTHKPASVSTVNKVSAARPGRTAYASKVELASPLAPIGPIAGKLGPPKAAKTDPMFQRKFEQRQRLLKEMGGSKASEAAVARALVYLSRSQEKDGAWGYVSGKSRKHRRKETDIALTGLSTLCFLAGDHTPTKNGPYRDTVAKAVDYLVEQQGKDGSLWQNGGRMYGHAIATLALSEAAIMTGDAKYRKAAIKGAQFIVKAQSPSTGGWRYKPRESGDTSVLGWCVMALYSVQRMGMEIPPETMKGAAKWLDRVGGGKTGILCGYTDRSPKPAMSAEGAFSRMLMGRRPTDAQQKELAAYLNANKKATAGNFYLAYYGSLAMMQLGGDAWAKWNPEMRERLVALQNRGGAHDGAWTTQTTYASHSAGTIYTTSMATLTLEVYYRYLPMLGATNNSGGKKPAVEVVKPSRKKRK